MTGYRLSRPARRDLDTIVEHTVDQWGAAQAEAYIRTIRQAFELLVDAPGLGRTCDDIRPGYRKYPVGSHVILFRLGDTGVFFRLGDTGVDAIRVLHQRMDFPRRL